MISLTVYNYWIGMVGRRNKFLWNPEMTGTNENLHVQLFSLFHEPIRETKETKQNKTKKKCSKKLTGFY